MYDTNNNPMSREQLRREVAAILHGVEIACYQVDSFEELMEIMTDRVEEVVTEEYGGNYALWEDVMEHQMLRGGLGWWALIEDLETT